MPWPSHSPNLTTVTFFVRGYVMYLVYSSMPAANLETCSRRHGKELHILTSERFLAHLKSKDYMPHLLAMKGNGCNLLGRDYFSVPHIPAHRINQVAEPAQDIQEVLTRHPDVSKDDINGHTRTTAAYC